jgi:hypothetical protein
MRSDWKMLSICLRAEDRQEVRKYAADLGISSSEFVRRLIYEYKALRLEALKKQTPTKPS